MITERKLLQRNEPHRFACTRRPVGESCLPHNDLADPPRSVPHRARVLRPADRQQLGQQSGDPAEGCQRRIEGRDVGQFRGDRIPIEIQDGETLRLIIALAGAGEQPPDAQRHVAEQELKPHLIMPLAGQCDATGHA